MLKTLASVEYKLFIREPFAVFFTLLFPVMLLLIFGVTYGNEPAFFYHFKVHDFLIPAMIATVTAYLGIMGIPIALTEYREMGVLRLYRVSPLRLRTFLLAHFIVEFTFLIASCILIAVVGISFFHISFSGNLPWLLVVIIASAILLFAVGFCIASIVRSSRSAQAIGASIFFPLLFLSGAAIPVGSMPEWLQRVSSYLPLTKLVDALTSAWLGRSYGTNSWMAILYLLIVVAACLVAIPRAYKW
jgi:ABC-2 type transport system permease protein